MGSHKHSERPGSLGILELIKWMTIEINHHSCWTLSTEATASIVLSGVLSRTSVSYLVLRGERDFLRYLSLPSIMVPVLCSFSLFPHLGQNTPHCTQVLGTDSGLSLSALHCILFYFLIASQAWPWASDPPVSTSQVLELQVHGTMLALFSAEGQTEAFVLLGK